MNDVEYFVLHKYAKKEFLAKGNKYITFDDSWCIENNNSIEYAVKDFEECLLKSFNVTLDPNGKKKISFSKDSSVNSESFVIAVDDNKVRFLAADDFMLVQAIYYAEDIMKRFGDASLEKKEYVISRKIKHRITTSALEGGRYTDEYINVLLHYGYNGIILYESDVEALRLAKKYGINAYLFNVDETKGYDGIITEEYTDECHRIFYTPYWENKLERIKNLPDGSTVILSFDDGQRIQKDGVEFETVPGSLVMAQPSDSFVECYKAAKDRGFKIWVLNFAGGRTTEFGSVPYIPAMMQWFMRSEALSEFEVNATVEADRYGFIPSIVGEFTKAQNFSPCDEGGICIQKIASMHFGPQNIENVMMAFKKVTDGVNFLLYNFADYQGPLQFGPAYPLVNNNLYQYDFSKDITLETDVNMNAAACFNKAAMILSHIDNEEAQVLKDILNFAVNTLVTCANAKRWYRRIHVLENTTEDYKKKFLYEQLVKIGEQEIKNAYDTADILINAPFLQGNNSEVLCSADALEAKIKLTQKAINEIQQRINN